MENDVVTEDLQRRWRVAAMKEGHVIVSCGYGLICQNRVLHNLLYACTCQYTLTCSIVDAVFGIPASGSVHKRKKYTKHKMKVN